MKFEKALEAMKNGAAVKLPSWKGFWKLENGRIKMHCKDGKILEMKFTSLQKQNYQRKMENHMICFHQS